MTDWRKRLRCLETASMMAVEKDFVRDMARRAKSPTFLIHPNQERWLTRLAKKYHRQLPAEVVPRGSELR